MARPVTLETPTRGAFWPAGWPVRAKEKTPTEFGEGFLDKAPGGDLLLHGQATLPSARLRFTSEFGMGSGGTTALWPPGKGLKQRYQAPASKGVNE